MQRIAIVLSLFTLMAMTVDEPGQAPDDDRLIEKADQLFGAGKYRQACRTFEKAQKAASGQSLHAALGVAQSYVLLGEPEKAHASAKVATALAQDGPQAILAHLLSGTAAYHRARDLEGHGGQGSPKKRENARLRSRRDLLEEADESLRKAIELNPESRLALVARTEVNLALNERGKAKKVLAQLQDLDPDPRLELALENLRCLLDPSVPGIDTPESLAKLATGAIQWPKKIYSPTPKYTGSARENRWSGTVTIEAVIDEQGGVPCGRVISGAPYGISEQTLATIRQWRYEPARFQGEPTKIKFLLSVAFDIR